VKHIVEDAGGLTAVPVFSCSNCRGDSRQLPEKLRKFQASGDVANVAIAKTRLLHRSKPRVHSITSSAQASSS
jgi:hypothetical protein